jgi:hypothetical protein
MTAVACCVEHKCAKNTHKSPAQNHTTATRPHNKVNSTCRYTANAHNCAVNKSLPAARREMHTSSSSDSNTVHVTHHPPVTPLLPFLLPPAAPAPPPAMPGPAAAADERRSFLLTAARLRVVRKVAGIRKRGSNAQQ